MNLQLEGKTALVLSASKGIGAGVATALLREGARVTITSSNQSNLESAQEQMAEATGSSPAIQQLDLTDQTQLDAALDAILASTGGIDVLVTNGPGPKPLPVTDLPEDALRDALGVNLVSMVRICNKVLPRMREQRFGRLIHLTSTTGKEPDEGMVLSNITRAAMLSYSKTLARELGGEGITSNAVLTGGVLTDRTESLIRGAAESAGETYEKVLEQAVATIPVGYIASPDVFAHTIVYLASPLSRYVNGVSLPVDGGVMRSF